MRACRRPGLASCPLTLDYIRTGQVAAANVIGPSSPQLSAALAAEAARLVDRSREHFETALPPPPIARAAARWSKRSVIDFRALEMVVHANLAEQLLRE